MTSRGFASLQVAAGLPEVLACPEVAAHAREVEPHAEPVHALGDLHDVEAFIQTARDQGWTRGAGPGGCSTLRASTGSTTRP